MKRANEEHASIRSFPSNRGNLLHVVTKFLQSTYRGKCLPMKPLPSLRNENFRDFKRTKKNSTWNYLNYPGNQTTTDIRNEKNAFPKYVVQMKKYRN
ncbi:unnamed protein product [Acanthoscelides obtectus]|uniref:Uncharacterized protein n=1 Tax=Acanthoscelides obtectus TaxID=200917 RepID=A0A9P0P3L5_ACAOB|nr:unnamed protein product [Acanthoscelides obtectus]CAK1633172.1 hypothetical protein AOBTE_LOCUS7978 [Acanthoscelides obtectus]